MATQIIPFFLLYYIILKTLQGNKPQCILLIKTLQLPNAFKDLIWKIPIVKYLLSFTAVITSIAFPAAEAIILKSLGTRWLVLNSVHKRRNSELAQENIDWQNSPLSAPYQFPTLQLLIVLHVCWQEQVESEISERRG